MSVVETLIATQPRQVVALPLEQVRPAVDNVRSDLGDVASLAASIEATGLLQPIVVYPPVDGDVEGMHEIVAGHRRYAAHQLLGKPTIDAIVQPWPDDDAASTAARIIENVQREDLTVLDEARAYASLADAPFSWTQRQIAEAVGVNQSHVSKRIKLAALPDPALDAVGSGQCRIEDGLTLCTLMELDPGRGAQLVAKGQWRRVDNELRDARRDQARRKHIADVEAAHAAGEGPPLHPASTSDRPPWSPLSVQGVSHVDHYQFRDAGISRDRMLADGNLAVVVCADGETAEVCTDPQSYFPKQAKAKPRRTPGDVAAEARAAFIDKLVSDPDRDPPPAHEALIEVLTSVALRALNGQELGRIIDSLGLDLKKSASYGERLDAICGLLEGDGPRPNSQVTAARRIALAMCLHRDEFRTTLYGAPSPSEAAHLRRLEAAGYPLSKVEVDYLADVEDDTDAPTGEIAPL